MITKPVLAGAVILASAMSGMPDMALAQTEPEKVEAAPGGAPAVYKPPLRGAPGGRVGGASRGITTSSTPLPTIELIAPGDHAGLTASATPTLYFSTSGAVTYPSQFTISAPLRPQPVLEVTIPSPSAAGIYALRLGDYRARLEPGIIYTWSVSVIVDPKAWSRNVVASAAILRAGPDPASEPAIRAASPTRRAGLLAQAGLWYDAVAAAAESQALDRHAALDALMVQVGLGELARSDQMRAGGLR